MSGYKTDIVNKPECQSIDPEHVGEMYSFFRFPWYGQAIQHTLRAGDSGETCSLNSLETCTGEAAVAGMKQHSVWLRSIVCLYQEISELQEEDLFCEARLGLGLPSTRSNYYPATSRQSFNSNVSLK